MPTLSRRARDARYSRAPVLTHKVQTATFNRANIFDKQELISKIIGAMATPTALPTSDNLGASSINGTPKQRAPQSGSSARPRGPPSDSQAPQSDDEGFADDQIPLNPNRPRNLFDQPIPRVEDKVGLVVQEHFERFLET